MALRHLQLLRNSSINQLREGAKSAAQSVANLKDGDVIVARYLIQEGQGTGSTNVAIAIGHKVGGEGGYIVWNDNQELRELISASTASTENLEKAVGVAHNASAITFDDNVTYISSGSAKDALEDLDAALKTTDDLAKQVQAAVGSSASTLNIENGNYVASSDTVKQAVTKLDSNLYIVSGKTDSGITAFNNYTTQVVGRASGLTGVGVSGSNFESGDTVISAVQKLDAAIESGDTANDNLRKAVGAAEGASAMTYGNNTHYISGDTTVSGALVTLATNLHTVSGDLDTLEGKYDEYTAATDANTAATNVKVDKLLEAVGVNSGDTNLGLSGNYVQSSGTVKEDIRVLDEKLKEVSGASTTDIDNLRKAVGVQSGDSAITITGAHYATGNTVVTALTQLDTQLYSATTKAENAQTALGSTGTTLGANGQYVSTSQTAKVAVETLDSNLVTVSGKADNALTYVGNIDSVVGVQNTDTTFATTGEIASSTTTVKGAVEALDSAIVDLSGKTASDDDLDALAKAVGVEKGVSSMTFSNTNYLNGQTSASGALVTLDSTINTVSGDLDTLETVYAAYSAATDGKINAISGKVDNAQTALGSTGTTLNANGTYVKSGMTAKVAVETLDTVEKATRDTIGGMKAEGTSGLTLTGQHYISGDPTVVSALTDLDTNLYALSGKATSNTILAQNPISSQTIANSGTTVGLKLDAVITDTAVTSTTETEMHKNILAVSENGLYALADLHYDATLNKLTYVNTNGKKDIQLTGVNVFDNFGYSADTEEIYIDYTKLDGTKGQILIPVGDIIEEYSFQPSETPAEQQASSDNHNVSLVIDRHVSGDTLVYGELSVFDCGTY